MSLLSEAMAKLKPATDESDAPVLQSEYDAMKQRIAGLEQIVAEYREREYRNNSEGLCIPHNAPITETEMVIHLRAEVRALQDELRRMARKAE